MRVRKIESLTIESDAEILGGKPTIKGTRVPVSLVLELLDAGVSPEEIAEKYYPHLSTGVIKGLARLARTVHETVNYDKIKTF
ncbi:MAG: DUF433 domain-containing protein [Thermoplasmata archaeon]